MTTDAWITVGLVLAMLVLMIFTQIGADVVMLGGLTFLLALGILEPQEAFAGFANPALVAIAALLVIAAGVRETGAMEYVARFVLGKPRNLPGAQMRMMFPVAALSMVLNNTPLVAMFVPLVSSWARRFHLSVSMMLMPLSFATILGGTCTLIGTSTNLVVVGLAHHHDPSLRFGMFDIAIVGVPVTVLGIFYIVIASRYLLKDRVGVDEMLGERREYTIAMRVEKASPVIGQTIDQAGLRRLKNLYLYEIERDGGIFPAVAPTHVLKEDDRLHFTGVVDDVVDFRKLRIVPDTDQVQKLGFHPERHLVEAVVAAQSNLVGLTVRESQFRTHYDAAIIAIHRSGERVPSKVGDIVVAPGDVLLIEAHPGFVENHRLDPNFALISQVEDSTPPNYDRAGVAAVILLALVVCNTLEILDLTTASLIAAALMLLTRCVTENMARRSLEISLLITVAGALGLSVALQGTGAADAVGASVVEAAAPFGTVGLLVAVYVATSILTNLITNAAAAGIMFPIAASAAAKTGVDIVPVAYLIMIGASAAFSTPIGYQTNLMVWGPGGYKYTDFMRLGVPLQALVGVIAVTIAYFVWL